MHAYIHTHIYTSIHTYIHAYIAKSIATNSWIVKYVHSVHFIHQPIQQRAKEGKQLRASPRLAWQHVCGHDASHGLSSRCLARNVRRCSVQSVPGQTLGARSTASFRCGHDFNRVDRVLHADLIVRLAQFNVHRFHRLE